jgi:hypothetical protein
VIFSSSDPCGEASAHDFGFGILNTLHSFRSTGALTASYDQYYAPWRLDRIVREYDTQLLLKRLHYGAFISFM